LAIQKLVRALAARDVRWTANWEGHRLAGNSLWQKLAGQGGAQLFLDPRYEENQIKGHDRLGPFCAYNIQLVKKDVQKLGVRPTPPAPKPSKPKARPGAERTYDHDAIRTVAKDVLTTGGDDRRAWFYERVRNLCRERHIKTPDNDRSMGRIIGDLYSTKR